MVGLVDVKELREQMIEIEWKGRRKERERERETKQKSELKGKRKDINSADKEKANREYIYVIGKYRKPKVSEKLWESLKRKKHKLLRKWEGKNEERKEKQRQKTK